MSGGFGRAMRGVIGPAVLAGAALAAGLFAVQTLRAPILYPKGAVRSEKQMEAAENFERLTVRSLSTYAQTLRRPLFSPARRAAPVRQPGETQTAQLKDIQLQGIVIDAGTPSAVIFLPMEGDANAYEVGAEVADWTIKDIEAREVTLTRGDETARLALNYAAASSNSANSRTADSSLSPAARRARRQTKGRVNAASLIDGMENE